MRKLSIAAIAAVSTLSVFQIASAADLPVKAPGMAAPPPAAYEWTGFYLGAAVGVSWSKVDNTYSLPGNPNPPYFYPVDAAAIAAGGSNSFDPSEIHVAGRLGYNYQINNLLVGAEIDFGRLGIDEQVNTTFPTPLAGPVTSSTSVKVPWLFTARPRIGYAFNNWLVYATGGLAVARVEFSELNTFSPTSVAATPDSISYSKTKIGWTVGGGVEQGITPHLSITAEYLYVDLGTISETSYTTSPFFGNPNMIGYSHDLKLTSHIARIGLNWRF